MSEDPPEIASKVGANVPADYAISPDGSRIAFISVDGDGDRHLSVARVDGTRVRRLTASPASSPAWSPDGSRVVVVGDGTTIEVVEVDDGTVTTVAHGRQVWTPSFAPDGRTIVYTRSSDGGRDLGLWVVPSEGGASTRIHGRAAFGSYSPDGTTIAYHRVGRAVEAGLIWPFDFAISLIDGDGTGPARQLVRNAGCRYMSRTSGTGRVRWVA